MTACARSGEARQAFRLLDEMKREGEHVRPNTVVYNIVLGLCKGYPVRGGGGGGERVDERSDGVARHRRNGFGGPDGIPRKTGTKIVVDESRSPGIVLHADQGAAAILDRAGERRADGFSGNDSTGGREGVGGEVSDGWGRQPEELMKTALVSLDEMLLAAGGARGGGGGGGCNPDCAPDRLSFELVMQACINARHPAVALRVFRELRRWSGVGGGGEGGGIKLALATYRLGLTAASAAGDGAAAAVLLEEMQALGIDIDEVGGKHAGKGVGRRGKDGGGDRKNGAACLSMQVVEWGCCAAWVDCS